MNLMAVGLFCVSTLIIEGCGSHQHFPESSLTGAVFEVKIGESISPPLVTAKRGDEVRWTNTSDGSVDVSVVQTQEGQLNCQKGFASTNLGYLFGTSDYENIVLATVPPKGSASLCFALPGTYGYTVRRHSPTGPASNLNGSLTIE
jgi:plastocyanin